MFGLSTPETIQALTALFTGLAALATFLAVRVSLKLAERNQLPLILIHAYEDPDFEESDFIGYELENVGLGHAYVYPVLFLRWLEKPNSNILEGFSLCTNSLLQSEEAQKSFPSTAALQFINQQIVLRPGERFRLLTIRREDYSKTESQLFFSLLHTLDFYVLYSTLEGVASVRTLRNIPDPQSAHRRARKHFRVRKKLIKYEGHELYPRVLFFLISAKQRLNAILRKFFKKLKLNVTSSTVNR